MNKLDEIVVSSRIRLARNFCNVPFVNKLTEFDLANGIVKAVYEVFENQFEFRKLETLSFNQCLLLLEKRLISKELIENKDISAYAVNEEEDVSIMINEEDHLRMQCFAKGNNLLAAYKKLQVYDNLLLNKIDVAFDKKLGFLTACPSNVGTGMRASVMMFLPAITMCGQMEDVIDNFKKDNITIRGMFGENSACCGFYYQISNTFCIGLCEEDIIAKVNEYVDVLIKKETQLRQQMIKNNKSTIIDMCYRAYGTLTNCYLLDFEECIDLLSKLRFGIVSNVVWFKNEKVLDTLAMLCQKGHLCDFYAINLTDEEVLRFRAKTICDMIENNLVKGD